MALTLCQDHLLLSLKISVPQSNDFLTAYFNSNKIQSDNFDLRKQIISLNEELGDYNTIKAQNDFLKK